MAAIGIADEVAAAARMMGREQHLAAPAAVAIDSLPAIAETATTITRAAHPLATAPAVEHAADGARRILITVADRSAVSEAPLYLQQRLRELGHTADVARSHELLVAPGSIPMVLTTSGETRPVTWYDAVIARGGAELAPDQLANLEALEQAGMQVLNPTSAIRIAGSKHLTSQSLAAADVPHVRSIFVDGAADARADEVRRVITELGDSPLVIKPVSDLGGNGVTFFPAMNSMAAHGDDLPTVALRSIIDDKLTRSPAGLMVQPWETAATGHDYRVFFVDDGLKAVLPGGEASGSFRVTGAYERIAPAGVGTANVSKGAIAQPVTPDAEQVDIARRAARAVGLRSGAVDFIRTDAGWKVIEVNSSAGVRPGTLKDAGGDVAGALVEQILDVASTTRR